MVKNHLPVQETQETWVRSLGRSPGGGGNGSPLQYSCLVNSMDKGAWRATVHGAAEKSDMTERLNMHAQLVISD